MTDIFIHDQLQEEWGQLRRENSSADASTPDWSFIQKQARFPRASILFAELQDTRQLWKELLGLVNLDSYADRFVTSRWTIKDLIAHITSWASELREQAEAAARGLSFDYAIPYALSIIGPNEWNQKEVDRRRNLSLAELFQELDDQSALFEDLVLDLPEEDLQAERMFALAPNGDPDTRWKGTISQLVILKCSHERYHLDRIRQWQSAINRPKSPAMTSRRRGTGNHK
jgi:hypothetical protein